MTQSQKVIFVVKTPMYWQEEKYQPLIEVKTVYKNNVKIPSVMKDNWDFLMQCCENIIQREGRQRGLEIIEKMMTFEGRMRCRECEDFCKVFVEKYQEGANDES